MRRSLLACVLGLIALAVAVPLMAQAELTISGEVVSSAPDKLVIKTDDGREMTFNVDAQSTIASGLRAGNRVTVKYHDMSGSFHAANVTLSTAPATKTMPAETATTTTTQSTATTTQTTTGQLPATASPLPLVGLAGLLTLGAGLGLRALRRSA